MFEEILGGIFQGFLFGSGVAIGNEVTNNLINNNYNKTNDEEQLFVSSIVAQASLCLLVADADGNITRDEIETMVVHISTNNDLNDEGMLFVNDIVGNLLNEKINLNNVIKNIKILFSKEHFRTILVTLFSVAYADGNLDKDEEKLIRKIANLLDINDRIYNECEKIAYELSIDTPNYDEDEDNYEDHNSSKNKKEAEKNYEKEIYKAYAILEISTDSSYEEIKSVYKQKVLRYHPDKFVNMGSEFAEIARIKFEEIQKAYEILKRHLNFS